MTRISSYAKMRHQEVSMKNKSLSHLLDRIADMLLNCAVAAFVGSIFAPGHEVFALSIAITSFAFGSVIHYKIGGVR